MNLQDVKSSILILTAYECCYEGWKMRVDGSKNKWLETASWSDTHRLSETSTVRISCRRIGVRLVKLVGTHSPRYVKFICIYFVDSSLHPLSFFLSWLFGFYLLLLLALAFNGPSLPVPPRQFPLRLDYGPTATLGERYD